MNSRFSSFIFLQVILAVIFSSEVETCSRTRTFGDFGVIRKTDSDSDKVVVSLEDDVRLFCKTNAPWKKCLWRPPRSGVKQLNCLFTKDPKTTRHVCPSFPEVHYDTSVDQKGDKYVCAIYVHDVKEFHEGNWRCEFELEMSTKDNPAVVWDTVRLDARGIRYHH